MCIYYMVTWVYRYRYLYRVYRYIHYYDLEQYILFIYC